MDNFPIDYGNKRWDAMNGREVVDYVRGVHRRVEGEGGLKQLLLDIVANNTGVLSVQGPLGYEELCLKIAALGGVPGPVEMSHCRPSGDFSDSAPLRASDIEGFADRHPELFASVKQNHQSHTGKFRRIFCIDKTVEGRRYAEARRAYEDAVKRLADLEEMKSTAVGLVVALRERRDEAVAAFKSLKAARKAAGLKTAGSQDAVKKPHQSAINTADAEAKRVGKLVTAQTQCVKDAKAAAGSASGAVGALAAKGSGVDGAHYDLIATAWCLLGGRDHSVSLSDSRRTYAAPAKHRKAKRIRDSVSVLISRSRKTCPVTSARWEEKPVSGGEFTTTHACNALIGFSRDVEEVLAKSSDVLVQRILSQRDDEEGLGICPHVGGAVFSLVGFDENAEIALYSFGQTAVGFNSFWQDVCYMKTHTPKTGNAQHALLNRDTASVRAHAASVLHPECMYGAKTKYDYGCDQRKSDLNNAMRTRWGRAVYDAIHEVAEARGITRLVCPLEAFAPTK